jgi:hypothetical protein
MDDSRLFVVDGCSIYYQYDYTISPEGCFSETLVDSWKIWDSTPLTPNASYTLGIYDTDNLIVGEAQSSITSTGSTLYLYNLTTSGITKWLEVGGGAIVSNVYYNTGNTQMVLGYQIANSNDGYYELYSGSTNPQLISQIPLPLSAGGTFYFSGDTPISVNAAGVQYALDFAAGTATLITIPSSNVVPQLYVNFNDGFAYLSTIVQPSSCYDFNIPFIPPIPPGVLQFSVAYGNTKDEACSNLLTGTTINVYAQDLGNCVGCLNCWPCLTTLQQVYLDSGLTIIVPDGYYANDQTGSGNNAAWYIVGGFPQPAGYMGC